MAHLPITRMTLYKHGVGFFERRAEMDAEKVELSFREEEMNDILKSLTAIDWGGGQVLGIDYATPQSREERLAGCSIRLEDTRSLQDLLVSLRGRRVTLELDQGERDTGTLLGLDDAPQGEPLDTARVSLLRDASDSVGVVTLGRVRGVEILDERGIGDLRFFLETALTQEAYRSVTIRLTPGTHELSVSYIAPAPTWRVSYRLVAEPEEADEDQDETTEVAAGETGRALLQGWGIFDNRLEEDLESISLSLVAGMPISFIYDLYTPMTPERPVIEEEGRVAASPVEFEAPTKAMRGFAPEGAVRESPAMGALGLSAPMAAPRPVGIDVMQKAALVRTEGEDMGELFQYTIGTPVTVSRGHSAMVPIIQETLDYEKALIYNGRKMATHPVATLRLNNETGLTLERGPVTVLEDGDYTGEAVLPFTVAGSEMVVPYAVELGVKAKESHGTSREDRALRIQGALLVFDQWEIQWRRYQLNNTTAGEVSVLVEHTRSPHHELYDSPEPEERTSDVLRFAVRVPAQGEAALKVQERRLLRRREELKRQSYASLAQYAKQGLLKSHELTRLNYLLTLWERIDEQQKELSELDQERQKVYQAQTLIQGNMQALTQAGKEGQLRGQYVDQLEKTEQKLRALERAEAEAKAEIERLEQEVKDRIAALR